MRSLTDEIYGYIITEKKEFSEQDILREFFKIESNSESLARKVVEPLLGHDSRFRRLKNHKWTAVRALTIEQLSLQQAPFVLFYIEDFEKASGRIVRGRGDIFNLIGGYSSFLLYRGGVTSEFADIEKLLKDANRYIFIPYDVKSLRRFKRLFRVRSPLQLEIRTISLRSLVSVLYPGKKLNTWEDIAKEFSLLSMHSDQPSSKTKTLEYVFERIIEDVQNRKLNTVEELTDLSLRDVKKVDFSSFGFEKDFLRDIPEMPGVYLFSNREGKIIYVGKTNNLRVRINSYFRNTGESVEKIRGILDQLYTIEYRVLGSDLEALIQEYRLIDLHRPSFNRQVKVPERPIDISDRLLLLPSRMEGMIKIYILSKKTPLLEYDFDCSGGESSEGGAEIIAVLRKLEKEKKYVFDPLRLIALFYLRRYEENVNAIDIETYGTAEKVMDAIHAHCSNLQNLRREKTLYI